MVRNRDLVSAGREPGTQASRSKTLHVFLSENSLKIVEFELQERELRRVRLRLLSSIPVYRFTAILGGHET